MSIKVRKIDIFVEKKFIEIGEPLEGNHTVATVAVTAENPYTGKYSEDLSMLTEWSKAHAKEFLQELLDTTGLTVDEIVCYGKSAIIGVDGEMEHGAALLHPTLGAPIREFLNGTTVLHSTVKVGLPGCTIDAVYDHKTVKSTMDYINNIPVSVPGAPQANEFVLLITVATNMRPLARNYSNAVDLSKF